MGAVIDTSVLIAIERGKLQSDVFRKIDTETLTIAAITASELLHGVHRAQTDAIRARREAMVEAILDRMPVLPFDLHVARSHARLSASLAQKGIPIGHYDALIAATALAHGYHVMSTDSRSFPHVPGLQLTILKM
jgi:predicted nucleic acid-binding protein